MIVATNMMPSVLWLLEASQTVRLLCGCEEEGSRNGNKLTPIEPMTPAMPRLLTMKTRSRCFERASAATSNGAARPTAGASIVAGQRK